MARDLTLDLPRQDGRLETYRVREAPAWPQAAAPPRSRVAFAAAHVVADPADPERRALDWDATLAYRRHLWRLGFGVAEAMDTAQRGMGLPWSTARELIRRSCAEARALGARVACGAGTDTLGADAHDLGAVEAAYHQQTAFVEEAGGQVILMASRALARSARGPDDYARVYDAVLRHVRAPVILHWLGDMFDPQLRGYWGSENLNEATGHCLAVIQAHADKVDGIKVSLLDEAREVDLRARLPRGVRLYTGDDFNYPRLIRGNGERHSDALLGIFDAIAPAAAAAFAHLDAGDGDAFEATLAPTVPLARHIFETPTFHYKTGIVFLAYLNGHQDHFRMVGGLHNARSVPHLGELFALADAAGLLRDPELAVSRMRATLRDTGVMA